jgi:hypothetical protein
MKTDDIFFPVLATLPQPVMCFLGPYPSFKWLTHLQDVLLTGCVCDWSWFNWWYRIKFFLSIIYNVFIIFYLELDISYIWAEGEEYFPSLEFSVRLNSLVKVVGLIRRPSTGEDNGLVNVSDWIWLTRSLWRWLSVLASKNWISWGQLAVEAVSRQYFYLCVVALWIYHPHRLKSADVVWITSEDVWYRRS